MTLPPCLLPDELQALTGRKRPSAQGRVLTALGVRHYVRDNTVVVFREDLHGDTRKPHPFYGLLRPIDWWEDNRQRMLLNLDAMYASAINWKPKAPHESGIYFLFFDGELQYVGQANSIARRFNEHEVRKTVPVDAAGWILCPELFMTRLEHDYWNTYAPPYNFKAPQ